MTSNGQPIKSGIFIMPFHPPDKPLAQCYEEDVELAVRAEALGFDEFWIGEHHTMKYESVVVPEVFIGRILGETERIRLGPAPICANLHHPAYLASRLAFLDHLSKGRLNLCFGPSAVITDYELYGLDPKEGGAMTVEAIDVILKLWSTDPPYEHDGKFWQFSLKKHVNEVSQIGFIHKPLQQPHPPILMPGIARNSYSLKVAGQYGFGPYSAALAAGNILADNWETYARSSREAGREPDRADWRVARAIFLADTTQEAVERVRTNSVGQNFQYIASVLEWEPGPGRSETGPRHVECRIAIWISGCPNRSSPVTWDHALERLLALIDECGPFGTLVLMGFDWDDKASWLRNLELFANELMPALNKALA